MLQLCSNAWAWRLFPNPLLSLTYDLTCFMTEIIIYFSQRNCYLTLTHFMSLISLISLENIRKLLVFCFQGVSKEISGMKWVNEWMNNENNLLITPNPPNLLNIMTHCLDPLSANPTKWSNRHTICRQKQTNCLSVFDHFVGLTFKGLFNVVTCNEVCISNSHVHESWLSHILGKRSILKGLFGDSL